MPRRFTHSPFHNITDMIHRLITLLLLITMLIPAGAELRFRQDGEFKIVQFTDIHWKPGKNASDEARRTMEAVLDAERPDLVVYTGDLAWARPAREAVRLAVQPCVERGIPFAVTWGNHDDEFDATREELFATLKGIPGNLTDSVGGLTGVTNYTLPLLPSKGGNSPAAMLYVLDSNSYIYVDGKRGYAGIQPDQIEWFAATARGVKEANGGKAVPSLVFCHVPFNEVNEAATNESATLIGTRRERASSPTLNTGMFSAMARAGGVMGAFFGHDHINDYTVMHRNILLGYGRYTGGKTVYCDMPGGPGARVISLKEGAGGLRTWVRLADGHLINAADAPHDFQRWK